jgi:uncharacterized membrane protein YvlD (DUF360 family)
MAYSDYTKTIFQTPIKIPTSPSLLMGAFIESLISGFTLWLAVKIVGGSSSFMKAVLFSLLMKVIYILLLPLIPSFFGLFTTIIIGMFLWIILVMKFFKVGFIKAIIIAIVQTIVSVVLAVIAIGALVLGLIDIASL